MRIQMDEYLFGYKWNENECESEKFMYQCTRPGDNSGIFIKKDDVQKLKAVINEKLTCINHQASILLAVQRLEYVDKNFLCDGKKLSVMKRECIREITKLTNKMSLVR